MTKLGEKLGKLSLAILENFVEGVLGEKFVDELRAPTDKVLAIETALENSERRFVIEFSDKAFAEKMFAGVNDSNLGLLSDAIEMFYDHPTDPDFQNTLNIIITGSFPDTSGDITVSATSLYVIILTEEFALADEKFRENVRALSDLRTTEILRKVEILLSQKEVSNMKSGSARTTLVEVAELLDRKSDNEYKMLVLAFLEQLGKRPSDLPKKIDLLTHADFLDYLIQIKELNNFYNYLLNRAGK